MRNRRLVLLAVLLLGVAVGCQSAGPSGPRAAVESFYTALNEGRYDDARAHYTAEAAAMLSDPTLSDSGDPFREWADAETRGGKIAAVNILEVETPEGSSETTVRFEVRYADGSAKQARVSAREEEGAWKLGIIL